MSNYFKAYLWTSRADLRVLDPAQPEQSRRELGTAIVLSTLLRESGRGALWRDLDDVVRLFVGRSDAMNFAQLDPLLAAAGIRSLDQIVDTSQIAALQKAIIAGGLGVQFYAGDVHASPFGPEQAQLPRAFVFTGQRFVADGWALAQVSFDRVPWFEEIPGATWNRKVLRRVPDALDVAYAVLGNRQAGPELARRMLAARTPGNFRDGYPYAHSLEALAGTFRRYTDGAWTDTLYTRWLAALRELSAPTTDAAFPQAMRTRAWAMHGLITQLASYTELKHDTLLYEIRRSRRRHLHGSAGRGGPRRRGAPRRDGRRRSPDVRRRQRPGPRGVRRTRPQLLPILRTRAEAEPAHRRRVAGPAPGAAAGPARVDGRFSGSVPLTRGSPPGG